MVEVPAMVRGAPMMQMASMVTRLVRTTVVGPGLVGQSMLNLIEQGFVV